MRGLIFLLVFGLSSPGTAVNSGVTPPLPVPSPDAKARRAVSASQDKKTSGSVSKSSERQGNGTECLHNDVANYNSREKRSAGECSLSLTVDTPEKFRDENGVNALAIGLGLDIAAVVEVAVIAALFLNRNRLRKCFHDMIAGTDNHMRSQKEQVPLNPGLPEEAGHKEIQKSADAENEKMVVIDLHEAAGDQSQFVTDRHVRSNINLLNVVDM